MAARLLTPFRYTAYADNHLQEIIEKYDNDFVTAVGSLTVRQISAGHSLERHQLPAAWPALGADCAILHLYAY